MAGPAKGAPRGARPEVVLGIALGLAWLTAALLPFQQAFVESRIATDFTRDFIAAKVLARGEPLSTLDGPRGNREAVQAGAAPVAIIGHGPFHLHPPPASLPVRLLVPLGYRGARVVWQGLSFALLAVLAWVLAEVARPPGGAAPIRAAALFPLLVLWPPTLTNFELGQWSVVLAPLLALGFRAWDRGRRPTGAIWLALATALKLTPVLTLPFVLRRDRRAGAIFTAVTAAAVLVALPLGGGVDAWVAFWRDAGVNVEGWQTWWHNTLSINGLAARLLVGGPFSTPLVSAPALARALVLGAGAALGLAALLATLRHPPQQNEDAAAHDGCVFALWNILIVVLNPLAWTHYALLLLLPVALVARATARGARLTLPEPARRRARTAAAVALVILTVPKETCYLLARPLPSSPLLAPLLSLHLFGALLLFAAAYGATAAFPRPRA